MEPPEPGAAMKLAVWASNVPAMFIFPPDVRLNALPVETHRYTGPLSVNVTFPEVLALK